MPSGIQVNVEKTFDRGPRYPFLEVQVNFEEKSTSSKDVSLAYVIVSFAKGEVGSMSLDELRKKALSKALSFMEDCIKSSRTK